MRFLEMVERRACEFPEAVAQRTSAGSQLTYGELWHASGALARELVRRNASHADGSHDPVLVYGHKSPLMLVGMLACMRSGHPYVPVDAHSVPDERAASIARQLGEPIVLAAESLPAAVAVSPEGVLSAADIRAVAERPADAPNPAWQIAGEDLCYILFTSGSTGAPKGVEVTANCFDNFCGWDVELAGPVATLGAVWIDQAPFSFDLSVFELAGALATGGTLFSLEHDTQQDMEALLASLAESGAAVWVSTPSFADLCLVNAGFSQEMMPNLRLFLFCGETLANSTAAHLLERFPRARVLNTYGPTESTVAVTAVEITPQLAAAPEPLPVGSPRPGTRLRIVDAAGIDAEAGRPGEVVIEGDTVARGYYGRDDLTRAAFGTASSAVPGAVSPARSYRTGDEGWLDESGMLHYHGRLDLQVKLNGFRIELGEIEEQLRRLPGVDAAAVTTRERDGKVSHLVAHVVYSGPRAEGESDFRLGLALKEQLKPVLPHYMVPKKIAFLNALPRTGNGKVDRRALKAL